MELLISIILCLCLVALSFLLYHRSRKKEILPDESQLSASASTTNAVQTEPNADGQSPGTIVRPATKAKSEEEGERIAVQNKELVANLHKVLEEDKVFLRNDIHIDDVARMLYTNRTYVTRLMRQEYGLTFIEYINVARLQYSQKLLYSTDMGLDEIARQSGFQSTSNYCRAFRRYMGLSPLSWLQTVKKD